MSRNQYVDYTFFGTGTSADNSRFAQLCTAISAQTRAVKVAMDGMCGLNGGHNIDNPYGVEFVSRRPGSGFIVLDQNAYVVVGASSQYSPNSGTAMSATAAFVEEIDNSLSLVQGDWFVVSSTDAIPGVLIDTGYAHCPSELHQVRDIKNGKILMDDFIVDALVTTPKIAKITMRKYLKVQGLTLIYGLAETVPHLYNLFYARHVEDVVYSDNYHEALSPNGLYANVCGNVRYQNNGFERLANDYTSPGYCIVLGLVQSAKVTGNDAKGHRHFVTTDPHFQDNTTSRIYGTQRNVVIANNSCATNSAYRPDGVEDTMASIDLHCNGWGTHVFGNTISAPSELKAFGVGAGGAMNNQAIKIRARHTHVSSNRIDGGGAPIGIDIYSSDNQITENHITGCSWGINIARGHGGGLVNGGAELTGTPTGTCIMRNIFDSCAESIRVTRANDTRIVSNDFVNGLGTLVSFTAGSCGGTKNRVANNDMPKASGHTYAIDPGSLTTSQLTIIENICDGYAGKTIGINTTASTGPAHHTAALTVNRSGNRDNEVAIGNSGAAITVNYDTAASDNLNVTLNANTTITVTATVDDRYLLSVTQDGTGSRTIAFTGVTFRGTLDQPATAAGATTVYEIVRAGGQLFGRRI